MGDGARAFTFATKTDLNKVMQNVNRNPNDNTNKEILNIKKKNAKAVTFININDSIALMKN